MQVSPDASVRVGTVSLPAFRWRLRIGYRFAGRTYIYLSTGHYGLIYMHLENDD